MPVKAALAMPAQAFADAATYLGDLLMTGTNLPVEQVVTLQEAVRNRPSRLISARLERLLAEEREAERQRIDALLEARLAVLQQAVNEGDEPRGVETLTGEYQHIRGLLK
jgi:hypothetical protein